MAGKVRKALGYEPSIETIKDILGDSEKVIAYYPRIARWLKSTNAALMLQQLVFWQCRTDITVTDGWVYKTIREIDNELYLSRYKQDTAIYILFKHDLIEKKVKGIPPKRYFRVKLDNVTTFLKKKKAEDETDHDARK